MQASADILLVQPPNAVGSLFNLPGTETPLSLLYLAGFLDRQGTGTEILDLTLESEPFAVFEKRLQACRPGVVGITSYTTNAVIAAGLASRARRLLPDSLLVLGGFHASALPERSLEEFRDFDAVVFGEGEETFAEIVSREPGPGRLESVPGVCYRVGEEVRRNPERPLLRDLDLLPFPRRDGIPLERYVPDPGNYFSLPSTGVLFSRGCPYECAYCSKSVFHNRIRYRSVDNFLDEIQHCLDRYGIRDFRFYDEGPTHSRQRMLDLCQGVLRRGLRITWNCYSRVDAMDGEMLRRMREAGCYHIKYGVESGVAETLRRICKPADLERAVEVCRMTRAAGIECKANFILGFPWEGEAEMAETVRYARRCAPDLATFNLFKPFPGSRLYEELERSGKLRHRSWEDYFTTSEVLLFESGLPAETYRRILKGAWVSFYLRPSFVRQRLALFRRNPGRELRNVWTGVRFILENLFK